MIDSGVLYALLIDGDIFHERAMELVRDYYDEHFVCPVPVVHEVTELTRRADSNDAASIVLGKIIHSKKITLANPNIIELEFTAQLMQKYKRMSFCDANSASIAQLRGIKQILSFDSDFDRVPWMKRIF